MVTVPPIVGFLVVFFIAFGLTIHAGRLLESYLRARSGTTARRFALAIGSALLCFGIAMRLFSLTM